MENYVFLILVAVVGLIRWISQAAENKRNTDAERRAGAPSAPVSAAPKSSGSQTEEERVRKFFEALGVPTTTAPPPKAPRRQFTPQPAGRTFLPVDPFPVPRGRVNAPAAPVPATPPPLPPIPKPIAPAPPARVRKAITMAAPAGTASDFEVHEVGAPLLSDAGAPASFAARLATPQNLRDAIVLREIFGPPRSMQPFNPATVG